ncbi:MAG: hypothetical protein U1C46_10755 [Bacteroidales bacterium]|nr:hypothetical protein [Bacteroidales bacterium]
MIQNNSILTLLLLFSINLETFYFNVGGINAYFNHDTLTNYNMHCIPDIKINNFELEVDLGFHIDGLILSNCEPNCRYKLINNNTTEELTILFYPGRTKNHGSYFIINQINTDRVNDGMKTSTTHFISGRGIRIGQNTETVKTLLKLDRVITQTRNDSLILNYILDLNEENCKEFQQKYNYPIYSASYIFVRNRLIQFGFGFEYP